MNDQFTDKVVQEYIKLEADRQSFSLRLMASENYISPGVAAALCSPFVNKSSEGYAGGRYHEGQENVDIVELLAIKRATDLFGFDHANVQVYSGSLANLAVLSAVIRPGDKILALDLASGGHLSHGSHFTMIGQTYKVVNYGVSRLTELIDFNQVRQIALREKPKVIICGGSSLPRTVDFKAFSDIAAEIDAVVLADVAHTAGLIAGGAYPSPAPFVDILTATTHKTLRGPRGALIACSARYAAAIDRAVFPRLQAAAHDHTTAAIAVALHEASTVNFRAYVSDVVSAARNLGDALSDHLRVVTGGTDSHLLLLDVKATGMNGRSASRALSAAGIEANANVIPFDAPAPEHWSGLRLGTAALVTRGVKPDEMPIIAEWVLRALQSARDNNEQAQQRIKAEIKEYLSSYPTFKLA